jgi:hypothetical protein
LALLEGSGARLDGFTFIVRDERPWAKFAESAVAEFYPAGAEHAQPPKGSPASSSNYLSKGKAIHAASSREAPGQFKGMAALDSVLDDPLAARIFVCAHEWGHSLLASRSHDYALHAAIAAEGPDGSLAMRIGKRREASRIDGFGHDSRTLPIAQAEEAFCDAVGCFVLGLRGMDGILPKICAYRKALARIDRSPDHDHHKILSNFFGDKAMPLNFGEFMDRALTTGVQAAALGMAESHAKLSARKAP